MDPEWTEGAEGAWSVFERRLEGIGEMTAAVGARSNKAVKLPSALNG